MLQAAGRVRGLVLEVQVNAVRGKSGQVQRDEVRVSTALEICLNTRDGAVQPGGVGRCCSVHRNIVA